MGDMNYQKYVLTFDGKSRTQEQRESRWWKPPIIDYELRVDIWLIEMTEVLVIEFFRRPADFMIHLDIISFYIFDYVNFFPWAHFVFGKSRVILCSTH